MRWVGMNNQDTDKYTVIFGRQGTPFRPCGDDLARVRARSVEPAASSRHQASAFAILKLFRQEGSQHASVAQLRPGLSSEAATGAEGSAISVGSVTSNRAPPYCVSDDADSLPPSCSIIILQIDIPNPVPFAFVVTNGSKMLASLLGSIPGPVSCSEMEIEWES